MPSPRGLVQQLDEMLHRRPLLPRGARLLVACSGGADSVALLRLLCAVNQSRYWGWTLVVGHVNHQLRGDASDEDARFVRRLAKSLGLSCCLERVTLASNARGTVSEAAARSARRLALAALGRKHRCAAIVLAHHADDQAETVLLRMLRGAGVRGLAAMAEKTRSAGEPSAVLLRPLLALTREQLRAYLAQIDQPWREDHTNASQTFLRNRVRHELLPLLVTYQPRITEGLCRLALHARHADAAIRREVGRFFSKATIVLENDRVWLQRRQLARLSRAARGRVLQELLGHFGASVDALSSEHLRAAVQALRTALHLPSGYRQLFPAWVTLRITPQIVEVSRRQLSPAKER